MTLHVILFFSYLHFLHDPGAVSARPCAERALRPAGLRPKPRGSTSVATLDVPLLQWDINYGNVANFSMA